MLVSCMPLIASKAGGARGSLEGSGVATGATKP